MGSIIIPTILTAMFNVCGMSYNIAILPIYTICASCPHQTFIASNISNVDVESIMRFTHHRSMVHILSFHRARFDALPDI